MRSREFVLLTGASAVLALAGLVAFGSDVFAAPPAPGLAPISPSTPAAKDLAAEPDPLAAPLPAVTAPAAAEANAEPPPAGWTKGVVKGDIQLAASALGSIRSIRVEIVEARRAGIGPDGVFHQPTRIVVPVQLGRGTPTFEADDVPFSEYPYAVSVHSPGLNGSCSMITVDAKTPQHLAVILRITPGAPLSILVRDQDRLPYPGLDVTMVPEGPPADRPIHKGTTDNAGGLVFDSVLAGDWLVHVQKDGLPMQPPTVMNMPPGGATQLVGHSYPLTIERGIPVQVVVHDRNYYPYVGAKVTATATDRVKLTVVEAEPSDAQGIARFAKLQPGTWQITVVNEKCHLWDKQITVQAHQDPVRLEALLVPIR